MTDDELRDWENNEDINDDLYRHFTKWGRWNWCEIADEARRIQCLIGGEDIEYDSVIDGITCAAVAHTERATCQAIAAALGVNANDLYWVLLDWSEKQDALPPPVTAIRFMEMIEETRLMREADATRENP